MIYPVIMAGGTGTRLWPLSRRSFPKQALQLVGGRTFIQHAVDRLLPKFPAEHIFIVTAEEHLKPLSSQVPEIPLENYIIEPEGRGTGPAIGLVAIHLHKQNPGSIMAVLTADHFIEDTAGFRHAIKTGAKIAKENYLVTLGIKPTAPSTGYGYIQQGELLSSTNGFDIFRAERFVEKPQLDAAQKMVDSGAYTWNSGMFIWKTSLILAEFQRQMPKFYKQLQEIEATLGTTEYQETIANIWPQVEKETIDYGVMEGAQKVAVIPVSIGWVDVGSWASLEQVLPADEAGNIVLGQHLGIDTKDTLLVSNDRLITTIGVSGIVIVDTGDAILVCTKEREQDVRTMVKLLEEKGRQDLL